MSGPILGQVQDQIGYLEKNNISQRIYIRIKIWVGYII